MRGRAAEIADAGAVPWDGLWESPLRTGRASQVTTLARRNVMFANAPGSMPWVLRIGGLVVAFAVSGMAPAAAGAEPGPGCTSAPDIREVQPVDAGTLKVARIGGSDSGDPDEWDMAYDTWWCNPTSSTYTVTAASVQHRIGAVVVRTRNPTPMGNVQIDPGANDPGYVMLRETGEAGQFPFPLPATARITLTLTETGAGSGPATVTVSDDYPLAEHQSPNGGYFPPFHQSDLPVGQYWSQWRHADSNFQRWGYDLGVERWTGSGWSYLEAGGDSQVSADFLIYGEPVYAMSDGEIIGCNRGAPDNADPADTVGNEPGGNMLWVRTGDETTLYAHLEQNSIPYALCPYTDDDQHKLADPNQHLATDNPYQIEAGDYLGDVGTSGFSRGDPHLHVHAFRGLPAIWGGSEAGIDADSRPLMFFNTQVQPRGGAGDVSDSQWNALDPAAQMPYDTLAKGDPCGELEYELGAGEATRVQTSATCFADVSNTMTYRGMRLVHIDVTESADGTSWTTVWRPREGVDWSFFHGLDANSARAIILGSTRRVLEIESYRVGGRLRFALILVTDPQSPDQFHALGETAAEFGQTYAEQTAAGLWPASISVTEAGDVAYISTVYEKANVGSAVVHAGIPLANYQQAFDDNAEAGRGLAWVESHVEDGQVRLAAIWYGKLTGPYAASGVRNLTQIESDIASNVANGGYTRALTGWQLGGPFNYLGLWRAAPDTQITSGPGAITASTSATFTFASSDPFATNECRLHAEAWKPCSSPHTYTNLGAAEHRFRVRARSREGVREAEPADRTWTVSPDSGSISPRTSATSAPDTPIAAQNPPPPPPPGLLSGACANVKDGARGEDRLVGTAAGDRLSGRGGNDVLLGGNGDDCLSGGGGKDALTGGSGVDKLDGGPGNDTINSRDKRKETVRCGTGKQDRVSADRKDKLIGCEKVSRR